MLLCLFVSPEFFGECRSWEQNPHPRVRHPQITDGNIHAMCHDIPKSSLLRTDEQLGEQGPNSAALRAQAGKQPNRAT